MARSRVALAVAAAALAGCGGMGSSGPASPTFTLSASGLAPRSAEVMSEGCVSFQNSDAVAHQMEADDPRACSELVQPQPLAPGATWTACMPMGPRTCAFHDASPGADGAAAGSAFAGVVQVDAPMMMPMMGHEM
ncbi:MAG TPA: hypothetical protein VFP65_02930 [Anaeromyxobacteraceae bacterium]|nr:hypothetical protein [Anaeromyxobacteraceae bacterium]